MELTFIGVAYVPLGFALQRGSKRAGDSTAHRATVARTAGYVMALAGAAGGLSVSLEVGPGLFVVALILIALLLWNLWDAWVLLIGVADEEIARAGGDR